MPIIHLRDLAAYGVVADVDPYNIPTNAFSYALNVRFDDGSIDRGIVYRNIDNTGGASHPEAAPAEDTYIGNAIAEGGLAAAFGDASSICSKAAQCCHQSMLEAC